MYYLFYAVSTKFEEQKTENIDASRRASVALTSLSQKCDKFNKGAELLKHLYRSRKQASDKNKIRITFNTEDEEFISFIDHELSKYQQFINDIHSALVSDMVIPKDTEYLSNAFLSVTNINQQRKKNILEFGDVVFLK